MTVNALIYDYGCFNPLIDGKTISIYTKDITKETISDYQKNLQDMFFDHIEEQDFQKGKVEFIFDNGMKARLNVSYALLNLLIWSFIIKTNQTIQPYHIFFRKKGITNSYIKEYIDRFPILHTREMMNEEHDKMVLFDLNRIIYDTLRSLKFVDKLAWYFNNSINIEDFILMYYNCPGFKEIMDRHDTDYYSNLPPDKINSEALKDMNRLIEYIIDAKKYIGRDHCLSDAFRAGVGIKPKQAREMFTCIGIKPNGEGGIFPYISNTSYISGGANNVAYHLLESLIARIAQILSKKNTADSGAFSRLMNLNCSMTRKYTIPGSDKLDPSYDCHTRNFVKYEVENEVKLKKIADRYYRLHPNGMEMRTDNAYKILDTNKDLIGKTIYLRSPITCKSAAEGKGVCRKCMGELYSIMNAVNIGIYSVTSVTQLLTQMMLSAKHLLEAKISELRFDSNVDISNFVYVEEGTIYINPNIPDLKNWKFIMYSDDINDEIIASIGYEDEDDDTTTSIDDILKYTNVFYLVNSKTGATVPIKTKDMLNMYFTDFIFEYIENNFDDTDDVIIPASVLLEKPLLNIGIHNDDMNERLNSVIKIIDLKANTSTYTKESFLKSLSDKLDDIGMSGVMSVHLEVIIMNQIRDKDNILIMPDWGVTNQEDYQILTLQKALATHPSITISMQSKDIARMLYDPLSLKKTKASSYDLIYMLQPQRYLKEDAMKKISDDKLFKFFGRRNK